MKQKRSRRRREFDRRQAIERLVFVMLMSVACLNLSQERMLWTKERSSHWWEHVVKSTFTQRLDREFPHVTVYFFVFM